MSGLFSHNNLLLWGIQGNNGLLAKMFKKFPKSLFRLAGSHFDIAKFVAKLSKKVIPPQTFADRLSCETVVLKNKTSTFIRYQSVVKTKFSLLSFYCYKNIIYVCFEKIYFYATILV